MKCLVVLSGGMDSATILAKVVFENGKDNVHALTFQYGSKHNSQELKAAIALAQFYEIASHEVIDLPFVGKLFKSDLLESGGDIPEGHYADPSMKRTVVPFRNGIMLSIAAGYAESIGAKSLFIGNHAGDHAIYPDCRTRFIVPMISAIEEGTYERVQLISPFCEDTKAEIVILGFGLQVPYHLTYSCYKGGEKHCGKCGTCFERKEAFSIAGIADPVVYA